MFLTTNTLTLCALSAFFAAPTVTADPWAVTGFPDREVLDGIPSSGCEGTPNMYIHGEGDKDCTSLPAYTSEFRSMFVSEILTGSGCQVSMFRSHYDCRYGNNPFEFDGNDVARTQGEDGCMIGWDNKWTHYRANGC
ncbi:Uu.00g034900.m01.CDS01 [Anthostomella pinea]|uniref:Uu.00g034900.m01.CDS01 n=1 Tax=Anthostomella pinea TaxID=933095 RepID=A0AAI8V9S0_9PEZI|nr:Uu.00g034900.m01.CDS01 [Anthostomella pinea]